MNKKIQEFAKYLGCCKIIEIVPYNKERRIYNFDIDALNYINDNIEYSKEKHEYKLVLKEIEDISEEDAKTVFRKAFPDDKNYPAKYYYSVLISVIKGGSGLYSVCDKLHSSYTLIDELRSKGYAIGIDKEYYITEKELK